MRLDNFAVKWRYTNKSKASLQKSTIYNSNVSLNETQVRRIDEKVRLSVWSCYYLGLYEECKTHVFLPAENRADVSGSSIHLPDRDNNQHFYSEKEKKNTHWFS